MLSECWDSTTVAQGQSAQCYASHTEWYLISPSPNRSRSWQTNGFAVWRTFSGGSIWMELRYRDAAFVSEPAQSIIRPFGEWSKRRVIGTQRHTCSYTQSISLCLFLTLSSSIFLSYFSLKLTFILLVTVFGLSLRVPRLRPNLCVSQASSQTLMNNTRCSLFIRIILCGCWYVCVSPFASQPLWLEWAIKSHLLLSLFSHSISSFLPL